LKTIRFSLFLAVRDTFARPFADVAVKFVQLALGKRRKKNSHPAE